MCNRAVEHNVAVFSELSLAVRWWGRPLQITALVCNVVKLLTLAAIVDNLAEKVDECPLGV